jgi:hypothetical protein
MLFSALWIGVKSALTMAGMATRPLQITHVSENRVNRISTKVLLAAAVSAASIMTSAARAADARPETSPMSRVTAGRAKQAMENPGAADRVVGGKQANKGVAVPGGAADEREARREPGKPARRAILRRLADSARAGC